MFAEFRWVYQFWLRSHYNTNILHLEKLILTNFKNYAFQELECSPTLNCFVGLNGMGKTNLLDAIYYLCMGKSHFNLSDIHVVLHDTSFFRLEGHFRKENKLEKIVVKVQPRRHKEMERNGVPYQRLSDHVGFLPVVFIAPDDTYLITEGSEARRSFLDNTLSQLDHSYLQHLIFYNKVLRQRNATLKKFGETQRYNPALIEVYDQQMLEPATYIHRRRQDFIEDFRPHLQEVVRRLSSARETVDCRYDSKLNEQPLDVLLREASDKDRVLERTTAGIHKDDLTFSIEGYPLKKFGSQGQLKSFVLALKLAQYELLRQNKGIAPLLLLDDIFDKLDRNRVEQLLSLLLTRSFGQVFITDTHEQRLEDIIRQVGANYRKFIVENGQAEPA